MPRTKTLTCYICNDPMWASTASKPQGEAAHNACRKAFVQHGLSGYGKGCRCGTCREAKNSDMRAYTKRRRLSDGISQTGQYKRKARGVDPLATVNCTICRKPLQNVRSNPAKFPMHKECKTAAPEWMRRGLPNPKIVAFRKQIEKAARGTSGGNRVIVAGECNWCGDNFVAVGAGAKFCSAKCKTQESFTRRSAGGTFKISAKKRKEIYERDGWTCQLCSFPVDPRLDHTHNMAATLDHVIPQALQLVPDHAPANLRLAHRWCNSARGDGSNMTAAELIARVHTMHMELAA